MTRAFGIQLRRSAAPFCLLLLLVLGLTSLFASPGVWIEGWLFLGTGQRTYLVFLWPLALALGAWQMRQEHRAGVDELFAGTAKPRWQRVTVTAAALAVAVTVAYALTFAVAAGWMAGSATHLPGAVPAMVAVGALSMVAAVCAGMGVGRLLPHLVTAPALAVVGFALQLSLPVIFRDSDWLANLLSPFMTRPWDAYFTLPARFNLGQAVWLTGLAGSGLLLLGAATRLSRTAAVLPVVLGLGVAVALAPRVDNHSTPWVRDLVAAELVCTDDAPRVCVTRVHTELLPEVAPLAREALSKVKDLPGAPHTAVEDWTLNYRDDRDAPVKAAGPDTLEFTVHVDGRGELSRPRSFVPMTLEQLVFRDCAEASDERFAEDAAAAEVIGFWLAGQALDPNESFDDGELKRKRQLWDVLQALPREQALQRIAAVRTASTGCSGSSLAGILEGPAR
ncbi:hypothetical protein [Couchioplanes caeruleus]|uniref:Uncharacterized protein n=2 Tax=Couchioplanes caeruleus TaxID=56438 RepID=A0A1K0FNJ6_9ACTN|nr:hypothetical protein [Couchioplanes caeruleus]OJF14413.1 hypothetical protein BG844_09945 [Couchioplanes caeruleus subsp. caeruleus]ROP32031.1 hypothetical protein EDD30_4959 [Couchioplanes caeruleus]